MEPVDRYLKAVAQGLPEAQREDILGELSEDIRSEMEDKERELGRPLTEAEQQAVLRQRGNPLLLAAHYRQDHRTLAFGRQLIGPILFPFYIKVLSFNLGVTSVVIVTILVALGVSGRNITFNGILSTFLLQLLIQAGVITLIFAAVERNLTKHPDRWDLSGVGGGLNLKIQTDIRPPLGRPQHVSRFDSVSIMVASTVALIWMTGVERHPFLILGPAAAFLKLSPIWYRMYLPIVLLTVAIIVRATINLARPHWIRFRDIYNLIVHCGGLAVVFFLIQGQSWVVVSGLAAGEYAHAAEIVNQAIYYALVITGILSTVKLVVRIARLIRGRPERTAGSPNLGALPKQGN